MFSMGSIARVVCRLLVVLALGLFLGVGSDVVGYCVRGCTEWQCYRLVSPPDPNKPCAFYTRESCYTVDTWTFPQQSIYADRCEPTQWSPTMQVYKCECAPDCASNEYPCTATYWMYTEEYLGEVYVCYCIAEC